MFLSLSGGMWLLIAACATVVNIVGMRWTIQIPEYRKRQVWIPVIAAIGIGAFGLRGGGTLGQVLFLYTSVLFIPLVLLAPIRGRVTRDHYRWKEDPTTKASTGVVVWILVSLPVMVFVIGGLYGAGR
ncbi:hypothetical protein ACSCBZ_02625 [Streptomyces niveiscabiei]|uniref:hypothetical protein n=1 Tax=Streptomyces niveiscabiei TaxID=164115 RepID=UPI003EBC7BC7